MCTHNLMIFTNGWDEAVGQTLRGPVLLHSAICSGYDRVHSALEIKPCSPRPPVRIRNLG